MCCILANATCIAALRYTRDMEVTLSADLQTRVRVLLVVAVLCAAATDGLADAQRAIAGTPAVPIEPITGILEMFKTHDVVALSEGSHGNEQGHAFRLALIRDPRFAATVNDIVVEFGNALYQDVIDRFVRGSRSRTKSSARSGRIRRSVPPCGIGRSMRRSIARFAT